MIATPGRVPKKNFVRIGTARNKAAGASQISNPVPTSPMVPISQ